MTNKKINWQFALFRRQRSGSVFTIVRLLIALCALPFLFASCLENRQKSAAHNQAVAAKMAKTVEERRAFTAEILSLPVQSYPTAEKRLRTIAEAQWRVQDAFLLAFDRYKDTLSGATEEDKRNSIAAVITVSPDPAHNRLLVEYLLEKRLYLVSDTMHKPYMDHISRRMSQLVSRGRTTNDNRADELEDPWQLPESQEERKKELQEKTKLLLFVRDALAKELRELKKPMFPPLDTGSPTSSGKGVMTTRFLAEADLRGAELRRANMEHNLLRWADLSGAKIGYADFGGADLREAHLSGAQGREARFDGAEMSKARLDEALLPGALLGARLPEADFRAANLTGANFTRANLRNARFDNAILTNANFTESYGPTKPKIEGRGMRN